MDTRTMSEDLDPSALQSIEASPMRRTQQTRLTRNGQWGRKAGIEEKVPEGDGGMMDLGMMLTVK